MNSNNANQMFKPLKNSGLLTYDEATSEMLSLFCRLPDPIKIHQIIRMDGFIDAVHASMVTQQEHEI